MRHNEASTIEDVVNNEVIEEAGGAIAEAGRFPLELRERVRETMRDLLVSTLAASSPA